MLGGNKEEEDEEEREEGLFSLLYDPSGVACDEGATKKEWDLLQQGRAGGKTGGRKASVSASPPSSSSTTPESEEEEEEETTEGGREEEQEEEEEDANRRAQQKKERSGDHLVGMGLRLYVLLLLHALHRPDGWQEIARALSLGKGSYPSSTTPFSLPPSQPSSTNAHSSAPSTLPPSPSQRQGRLILFPLLSQLLGVIHADLQGRIEGGRRGGREGGRDEYLTNVGQICFLVVAFLLEPEEGGR